MEQPLRRARAHYLKPNDRSETIHQCVFYDCETERVAAPEGGWKNVLVFGWAAHVTRNSRGSWNKPTWLRFTRGEELWKWIDSKARKKKTMYVWAHNQFFDYTTSCGSSVIPTLGWTLTKAIIDSPPFVITYTNSSSKLVLVDTLNIWRMSLKSMGTLVGLNKLDLPSTWSGDSSDDEYCRRDVEIILKAVTEWADFLRSQDLGKFCLTIASQSMQTFRHRYLKDDILIDSDQAALKIARAAYHGGRVECNQLGQLPTPLYLLDINSLYPYCMASYEFPIKLIGARAKPSVVQVADLLKNYLLCAHIRVETDEPVIPIKKDGKLIFPIGRFDAYVSSPELKYLLQHDQVRAVHSFAVYEKACPFVHFIEDLYQRRSESTASGDKVKSGHYKLLMNSFSGKWGQNGIKWAEVGKTADESIGFFRSINAQTKKVVHFRRFNGLIQRRDQFPESTNSHPAIAAHITAYGRMVLWALMREVAPENYFYCDTDSILVTVEGLEKIKHRIDDVRLGACKVVLKAEEAVLYGPKDYVINGTRTIKGIRDQAVQLERNLFRQERWLGFRGSLRKGWTDAPRTFESLKRLRRQYGKGIVGDGGRVFPFHLDEPPL